jgi:branched-chain amino acid transport system ATP-binding protein
MLEVRDLSVAYGKHRALQDVSVKVGKGEIVVILGANGAGKSSLLRAVGGISAGKVAGQIEMDGHPILGLSPDRIVDHGIALVPEGRGIFGDLSVRDNLVLGAYAERARDDEAANLERVFHLFPKLAERKSQIARTMSGGEQQMVAIGRAIMSNPAVLLLDEPSLGLSPLLCKELFASLSDIRRSGIGILLVEQNAKQSLAIADRGYLLENSVIVHEDDATSLANDPAVQKAYLGAGGAAGKSTAPSRQPAVASPSGESTPVRTGDPRSIAAAAMASLKTARPPGRCRRGPETGNAVIDPRATSRCRAGAPVRGSVGGQIDQRPRGRCLGRSATPAARSGDTCCNASGGTAAARRTRAGLRKTPACDGTPPYQCRL